MFFGKIIKICFSYSILMMVKSQKTCLCFINLCKTRFRILEIYGIRYIIHKDIKEINLTYSIFFFML